MRVLLRQLCICFAALLVAVVSGKAETITGSVTDSSGTPISKVTVNIPAIDRATVTNDAGFYTINRLPRGSYTISFSCIGFASVVRTIEVTVDTTRLDIVLQAQSFEMNSITVTATPQPTDALYSPQSVTIMRDRELQQKRGETVGETIASTPGVTMFTTGSNIAKPVIRGLSSQRVLVVSDGVRQEGQQWGDEHGTEIDPFEIESIEVVRGPSSVLYGSDALGGVVNIITKEPPSSHEGAPLLAGRLVGNGFSGNEQGAGAASLFGAYKDVGYRANLSMREAGDTRTPSGTLFNSGETQTNAAGAFGIHTEKFAMDVDYLHFDQNLQIHEDPAEEPDATPNQDVNHDRVHTHVNLPARPMRFEFNGGWQRNQRKEFEEKDAAEPVLYLDLTTFTADLKAHHQPFGDFSGTVGLSLMNQQNETKAEEKLIPEFDNLDLSAYLFEQYAKGKITLSGGLRVDNRTLDIKHTEGAEDFLVEAQSLDYSSVTGTIGMVYRATDDIALTCNVGRAWRAPTAFELFINGVHEGTNRFEIGRDNLTPEQSLNVDASVRVSSGKMQGELSGFVNQINDYIYLNPTGDIDSTENLAIYEYEQADAVLFGGEASLHVAASDWLIVSAGVDIVRGDNDATNSPLPLMPADRVKGSIRFQTNELSSSILNPYAEFEIKGIAKQNRIAEYETESAGYGVVDWSAGFEIPAGSERIAVDFGVNNLLDKSYRDHLSRYKDYADNPGVSAYLKLAVPFTLVK